jgi:AraC-like DNA-binding protein
LAWQTSGLVPLHSVEFFLERLARRVGDGLFLYHCLDAEEKAARNTVATIGLSRGETGLECARKLVQVFDSVMSEARFLSYMDGNNFWVLRTTRTTEWTGYWPVLQYNLRAMLSGMRQLFGAGMRPVSLCIDDPPTKGDLPEDLRELPIIPGSGFIGLAFPIRKIAMTDVASRFLSPETKVERGSPSKTSSVTDLSACMESYLGQERGSASAAELAYAYGMSERSYRRHLTELGTTHRQILSNARLNLACRRLTKSQNSVTEIAYELGYEHPSHFSRFFKQRVGLSPADFRMAAT